ncbi:hypothetical protein RD792_015938 [Penstemon davidsonii]|uniref:HMA domain-containing protein n=1 Tax=Penstemon davidsonii TaxID=160366 RepID=A0ABR0CHZ7_9LAMI|nr:hypothetical protein RD792_015938 [Penstemon davidsonii]
MMTILKIVIKVAINCQKCKTQVLKAVAKLTGVDEVTVDAEKGTLTVVGSVDPVCVITNVRKTGKYAEITSVGPPKKPDPPKPEPCKPLPRCCKECQLVAVSHVTYENGGCSIL